MVAPSAAPFKEIKEILVPTDFHAASDCALGIALAWAKRFDAHVTLLHVFDLPNAPLAYPLRTNEDGYSRAAQRMLGDRLATARRQHRSVDCVLTAGVPVERILETVREQGGDLIVIGSHGRGGLDRILIGSTALKVMRLSPIPVLTVAERGCLTSA